MSIVVVDEEGGQPVQANGMKSSRRWMGLGRGSKDGGRIKLCKACLRQRRRYESSSTAAAQHYPHAESDSDAYLGICLYRL